MAEVAQAIVQAARRAELRLAGRATPFLTNCWYVAGFASDFARELKPRTILGRPLVLYRTKAGQPVALSDRCIHRSYPLSASLLDGDTIICGYHGLRYDSEGRCIEAPAVAGGCPRGIGVAAYPLREQGPLVWIWMGNREPDADLPVGDWAASDEWPASQQYYNLQANYIALHENLLDLTHLSFVHAHSFGTPDYAAAPYTVSLDQDAGRFELTRTVKPTKLPPVWGEPLGLMGKDAARVTTSSFLSPAAHLVTGHFYAVSDEASPPDTLIKTAHLATPETATSTHYFIHHGRNFAIRDDSVTDYMQEQLEVAFTEDVVALNNVERMVAESAADEMFEVSFEPDKAGVAMRRWLLRAVEAERA